MSLFRSCFCGIMMAAVGCLSVCADVVAQDRQACVRIEDALRNSALKFRLPYGDDLFPGLCVLDKFGQKEYRDSRGGVVHPLGRLSRSEIADGVPWGMIALRLSIFLSDGKKALLYAPPDGERKELAVVNAGEYAVLKVTLNDIESKSERITLQRCELCEADVHRALVDGELLLVFTPDGVYSRPWYCRQFSYYWYETAFERGAEARIDVCVVDDQDDPVQGASVRTVFAFKDEERNESCVSGADGVAVVTGITTGHYLKLHLSKEGYYDSEVKYSYLHHTENRQVKDGKWLPWGKVEQIVLRKVRHPSQMVVNDEGIGSRTKCINKWVGYDIELNDFVAPCGNGKKSDFDVYIDWDGKGISEFSGMSVKIRFSEPYSGYYLCVKDNASGFKWPYEANADSDYLRTACFGVSICRDGSWNEFLLDKEKCLIVRSRCKVDEYGELIGANYSVISEIDFGWEKDGFVRFGLTGVFNSEVNDTNLEPKR